MRLCLPTALLGLAAVLHADERTFSVSVDGKPAGVFTIVTTKTDDGELRIHSKLDLRAKGRYSFAYQGTERWKDGRLVRLTGSGSDNGVKGSASLVAGRDGYALKAGAKEVHVRGEVWPSTFWLQPEAERPMVVDVVTGDVSSAKIVKVGTDRITVDGKAIREVRYRLTVRGATVDLWYDSANRLTRRSSMSRGQAINTRLIHIKRD